ncbi:MAG TPA: AAA family ATPase [Gemmataceae bacterium]|nr:AAA family ATPase [Gemmataceae bacterium]
MSHSTNSLRYPVTYEEMANSCNELPGWLWQGFIAFGSITLLTSRWKMGKTTLLSVLVSRLRTGGALAGLETTTSPALIISEESHALWLERGRKTPFGSEVRWVCRPFIGKPSRDEWFAMVQHLSGLVAGKPTLIVIDPLAMVLPGFDENNAGTIIDSLAPLRQLAGAGHAVLLLHHPPKGGTLEARGSGAISSIVDVLIQMDGSPNELQHPNRRWLRCRGRLDGVVGERLIELNEEHTDYHALDPAAEDLTDGWSVIEWVLNDADRKYTRSDILDHWPEMREKPHRVSLWKWLEQAVSEGRLQHDGEGRPHKPFRYWLRSREQYFFPDLPPLEPLGRVAEMTEEEEMELVNRIVEQGKEEKRREKVLKERRGR